MRSTTFRNVALGILAIVAAYQLGAQSAMGQTGGIECAYSASNVVAVIDHQLYAWVPEGNDPVHGLILPVGAPIPGSAPAIACSEHVIVLADGSIYQAVGTTFATTQWVLVNQFPSGVTPVTRATFGQIKAKYAR